MRILLGREPRSQFAVMANQRAGDRPPLAGFGVGLFDRRHNERADRNVCTFGSPAQPVVERLGNIDGGANSRDMIMSQESLLQKI
jgi:hypothetical protein